MQYSYYNPDILGLKERTKFLKAQIKYENGTSDLGILQTINRIYGIVCCTGNLQHGVQIINAKKILGWVSYI